MSRCILDDEDRMIQVLIGWDRGMQSFFARMRDRDLFLKEKRPGKPESEAGVRPWTGGFDRIWTTPDPLIEMIQPYACRHHKGRLREELLADQAIDEGDRNYSLYEDEPPEPHRPPG
ncbi:MAG: hypothetical protein ACREFP_16600 [Acetobacteraceae bacterium]